MAKPRGSSAWEKRQKTSRFHRLAAIATDTATQSAKATYAGGATIRPALAKAPSTTAKTREAISMRDENFPIDERTGSRSRSCTGATAKRPMLSWGQALTQSMHRVQSMFPTFCGMYNCSSQPRCCELPRMQSCVVQRSHVALLRACRVKGESREPAKLNWPRGQRYLQKLAPRNK